MNLIVIYSLGFLAFLFLLLIASQKGFRDKVYIAFLWFFWIGIAIIGTIWAILDAFVHNTSIEDSMDKIFDKKIFNLLHKLWGDEK